MQSPIKYTLYDEPLVVGITCRQSQVLERISKGESSPEIARDLEVSIETVKSHRKSLLVKFRAKNTAHLIRIAFERGILRPVTE